jgi:uncharacterized protein
MDCSGPDFDRQIKRRYYSPIMPLALTDRLDHGSAAQGRFHQTLSAKSFPRFAEMVLESDGSLQLELEVTRSSAGIALLDGRLRGKVFQQCQRCLGAVKIDLDVTLKVAVVMPGGEDLAPAGFEPWQAPGEVTLGGFVEEELILALPMIARHNESEECPGWLEYTDSAQNEVEGDEVAPDSPFAVLRELKKD